MDDPIQADELMFTGKPQKNRAAATTYFDEHLSHNDYYTQANTPMDSQAGQWIGVGCERLGLKPGENVTREAFLRLCDNLHPTTGERLTPGRKMGGGSRIFFDFQCAPPKSVSILAVTMEDKRIIQAHQEASRIALQELEQFAATRIRMGGIEDQDRLTQNLVGAAFMHTSSRALDPQLHTHYVLFNCTWDQTEERWKALQTSRMFDAIHYGTAVYRNELAKRLHQFGYQTRQTVGAFEIEGVDAKLIERFSKRSKQRDIAVAKEEKRLGRKLSKNEVSHVVHQTRPKKLKGVSDEEVRQGQLGEIGFFEKLSLRKVTRKADGTPQPFAQPVNSGEAIAYATDHVFERQSVAPEHRLWEAALVKGRGQLNLEQLKKELAGKPDLVKVGAEYSTRDILQKELYLIRTVNAGLDTVAPLVSHYEAPAHLGQDQSQALGHLLTSSDRITGFRGLAGSGKSTMLKELAIVLQKANRPCLFCAPTASAADTLRQDSVPTITLQKLLSDRLAQFSLSPRSVIVVDEAGAVGLDDMAKLFELAKRENCRVVLSGDTGQHTAVARGDALRILEGYSGYRFSELTTIRRQKPEAFRQAVELAAAQQTDKAFAKLCELGAVTEVLADGHSTDNHASHAPSLYQKAADAYLAATKNGKSALLVSPTWSEVDAVTEKVRETLKAEGVVSQEEQTLGVFDSLSWTEAQKRNPGQYEPGQQLRFVQKHKHFDKGETVEVTGIEGHTLRLCRKDGQEVLFKLDRGNKKMGAGHACFDVGEARELKVAAGDWLLLQANAVAEIPKDSHSVTVPPVTVRKDLINGERVQVREIRDGRIALADGRVLPRAFNAFTHGYAVTSHSSQGKTVDEVLLVASSRNRHP